MGNLRSPIVRFVAHRGPLARLAVCIVVAGLLALMVQSMAWVVGSDFSVLDKRGGSAVLIGAGLFVLLSMVAIEGRPMADYGLVADKDWARHGFGGMGVGFVVYAAYCATVWCAGPFVLDPNALTITTSAKAALAAVAAVPIAVTQQIIFSGFLVSTLRQRHGRAVAIGIPAALFAVACCLSKLGAPTVELLRLATGMCAVAVLLGVVRLRMGNIALPAGILAGAIAARKVLSKTRLLAFDADHPLADWLAPSGDPRQAPAFWALVTAAAAAAVWSVWRFGERRTASGTGVVHVSFKRVMPFSNLLAMAPLDRWLRALADARFRIGVKYLPRLVVTLIGSTFNTVVSLPERFVAPWLIRHVVPPPVFIVGMPRSGTTHLHNLLALDPQFRAPRNYEVFNPHGFLTGWLTTAILAPFLSWRRPMDAVQMQVFSPQEEEFALAGMCGLSPYWSFGFPRRTPALNRFWFSTGFSPREADRWARLYGLFLRKLTVWSRRTPLLKNPANTGRVALLRKYFPGSKFIHIHRHPHAVYRSNLHLAREGLVVFQLQDPPPEGGYEARILENYRRAIDSYYAEIGPLPEGDVLDVRYEDLDRDALGEIERIYDHLGWHMTEAYRSKLVAYLEGVAGYRKNSFTPLAEQDQQRVNAVMAPYLDQWGYASATDTPRAA